MKDILFAAGIEDTFIADPYPQTGKVLDEYDLTGHYDNWAKDFELIAGLGIRGLRWGIPWYRIEKEKGKFDFSFADKAIEKLDSLNITVILDLMHYGCPLWMRDAFLDEAYPERVCRYTEAVLEHYRGSIHYVTPFNEPHTAAEFCGKLSQWPPYKNSDEYYFRIMAQIVKGAQKQTRIARRLGMETVHIECSGGSFSDDPRFEQLAYVDTMKQQCFFDFLTGRTDGIERFVSYALSTKGLSEKDLDEFSAGKTDIGIMGINFYPQFSFKDIKADSEGRPVYSNHAMWVDDLDRILSFRFRRYNCPMMITETSVRDDEKLKAEWLQDSVSYITKDCAFPVTAYTWFPIIDMVDWEYRLDPVRGKEDYIARFGLFDSSRQARDAAAVYERLIKENE